MERKSRAELEELLSIELDACVKCGNCLAFCPIYRLEPKESAGMRGKLALLQAMRSGRTLNGRRVREILNECLGCQTCRRSCPNGVNTPLAMFLGNILLFEKEIGKSITAFQGRLPKHSRRSGKARLPVVSPTLTLPGHRPWLFRDIPPILGIEQSFPSGGVLVFPGCSLQPDSDRLGKVKQVLRQLGIDAQIAAPNLCCELSSLKAGDLEAHEPLVRRLLSSFKKGRPDQPVFLSPECLLAFKTIEFLYRLGEDERALVGRGVDFFSFLADRFDGFSRFFDSTPVVGVASAGCSVCCDTPDFPLSLRGICVRHMIDRIHENMSQYRMSSASRVEEKP